MSHREAITLTIATYLLGAVTGSIVGIGWLGGLFITGALLLGVAFGWFVARLILVGPTSRSKG